MNTMKHNWEYKKLGEIAEIQYGYPFDSTFFNEDKDGLPLVRIRDVVRGYSETYFKGDYPKEYIVSMGDYLIGMDGEFNIAQWKSNDALLNQRVCKISIKDNKQAKMQFLYYFLTRHLKEIEDETPFVTVKHLSAKRINQIFIPLPPLPIQQKIVAELDKVCLIIDKKKQQLKELDNLAQAIFYDMFGDPVENEKGWEVKKLGEVSLIKGRIGFRGYTRNDFVQSSSDGAISLSPSNIIGGTMDYGKCSYITWEKYYESPEIMINNGDIILVKTGSSYGKCAFVQGLPHKATINPQFVVIKEHKISSRYLTAYLQSEAAKVKYDEFVLGTAIPTFSQKSLGEMPILVPPLSLQQSFAAKIEAIEKQKELISRSIKEAQTLFDERMDYWFD